MRRPLATLLILGWFCVCSACGPKKVNSGPGEGMSPAPATPSLAKTPASAPLLGKRMPCELIDVSSDGALVVKLNGVERKVWLDGVMILNARRTRAVLERFHKLRKLPRCTLVATAHVRLEYLAWQDKSGEVWMDLSTSLLKKGLAHPALQAKRNQLPRCGQPREGAQELDSYMAVQVPAEYWIDMRFGPEWMPADQLPMPRHHATRLELTNLDQYPVLQRHQTDRVRFTIELVSREIHKTPNRHEWRASYSARLLDLCLP